MTTKDGERRTKTVAAVAIIIMMLMASLIPVMSKDAAAEIILPRVIKTLPFDGEENTSLNFTMTVWFSKSMNTTSVENSFTISPATEGAFLWYENNSVLYFEVHGWYKNDTWFTVTIPGNVTDEMGLQLDGNNNTYSEGTPIDDYTFRFFTDTPPHVDFAYPAAGADIVTISGFIAIVFSLTMNKASVQSGLTVTGANSGYTWSWSLSDTTAQIQFNLRPAQPKGVRFLDYNTWYNFTLNANTVKASNGEFLDGNGNGVAQGSPTDDYKFGFKTGATLQIVSKTMGAIGVDSPLVNTFNKFVQAPWYSPALSPTVYNSGDMVTETITNTYGVYTDTIRHDHPAYQNYWRGNRSYTVTLSGNAYVDYSGYGTFYFDGDQDQSCEGAPADTITYYFNTYPTPKATSTMPTTNATLHQPIIIIFTYSMDPSKVYITSSPDPDYSMVWSDNYKTLTLTPDTSYQWNTTYTIGVLGNSKTKAQAPFTTQVMLDGNANEWVEGPEDDDYTFTFRTVVDHTPPIISAYGSLVDGSVSHLNHTSIYVNYNDGSEEGGMGIDAGNITITINGEDYTGQSTITDDQLSLALDNLPNGFYTINITVYDLAGNSVFYSWTFEVHVYTPEQVNMDLAVIAISVLVFFIVALGALVIVKSLKKSGRLGDD